MPRKPTCMNKISFHPWYLKRQAKSLDHMTLGSNCRNSEQGGFLLKLRKTPEGPFRGTAGHVLSSCVACQSQRKQGTDGPRTTAEILGSTGFQACSAGLGQAACAAQGREHKENTGATPRALWGQ